MAEAEFNKEEFDSVKTESYAEDEFGIGLKTYLVVRFVFYTIGIFMILGALLALILGATTLNDLVSNATALVSTSPILDENFTGFQICMFIQAAYTILSAVCVALLYIKRTRLYAFIDIGLFVIFALVFVIMGTFDIMTTNGGLGFTAWPLYFLLNPIWSFIALFAGDHFKYMPMI